MDILNLYKGISLKIRYVKEDDPSQVATLMNHFWCQYWNWPDAPDNVLMAIIDLCYDNDAVNDLLESDPTMWGYCLAYCVMVAKERNDGKSVHPAPISAASVLETRLTKEICKQLVAMIDDLVDLQPSGISEIKTPPQVATP
jgi:hypothetical protein